MARNWRAWIIVYGVLNATAYSVLLPPFEGFDETYHYGYVQFLSTRLSFPVLGRAFLSKEIWHALELAPVSHYLQGFTRAPMNFGDYFKLSQEARIERRRQLETLPVQEKYETQSDKPNYEVNQSPLPYLWMALWDRMLSGSSLTTRILWLRLLCSVPAVLLLAHAANLLSRDVSLPAGFANAMLFCVFSAQMLYGAICHVCNDWLAAPLFGYVVWAAIRVHERGSRGDCLGLGALFAAALLTKAYFLVLTPLVVVLTGWGVWRRRVQLVDAAGCCGVIALLAGPWYVRNVLLYRNLSATVESTSGVGPKQLLEGALNLPWRQSIVYMAHTSLWTGNNSFTTFSSATLDVVLLLLAASLTLCFALKKLVGPARVILAAILMFCCGLAYITITFYAGSKGAAWAAVPWYMQVLLAPVLLLAFLGMASAGRWGTIMARATMLLWGYILAATYLVKLIPMYGGFPQARAHLSSLCDWYLHDGGKRDAILRTICLASPELIFVLVAAVILLDVVLCGAVLEIFLKQLDGESSRPRSMEA